MHPRRNAEAVVRLGHTGCNGAGMRKHREHEAVVAHSVGRAGVWFDILPCHQQLRCGVLRCCEKGQKCEAVKSAKVPPVPVQDEQNSGAASGQVVASSQAAKKGRAAIFGAAEDDSDDNLRAIVPRKQGRKGIRMRAAMGWAPITVRNITFVCTCRRGRQLLVPTGTDDLDRIVQHLLPRNGEEPRLTSDDFKDILSDDNENRIS